MNKSWSLWLSAAWIVLVILLSLFAPLLAPHDPIQPVTSPLSSPAEYKPMGSDNLGRDIWSRILFGGRITLAASFLALLITTLLGVTLGLLAAAFQGPLDRVIVGGSNTALAIPGLLLALLLVASLGPGFITVILAVGIAASPGFVRLSRSIFQQTFQKEYITAARALGAGSVRISLFHVLPNALRKLVPILTTYFAWAMLGITTLTFLGLAGDPSFPEWGMMLEQGRAFLIGAPWMAVIPGIMISLTVVSAHAIGGWSGAEDMGK